MSTISELNSRTLFGLGSLPAEWCSLPDVHAAVCQRLNTRVVQARASNINVLLAKSQEFTPNSLSFDITEYIGKGVPAFVEQLVGGTWLPVRTVNAASIGGEISITAGTSSRDLVCAFRSDESTDSVIQYLDLSCQTNNSLRIQFDKDSTKILMTDESSLPDDLSELIVLEAQNSLIPRIQLKISLGMNRSEQTKQEMMPMFNALQGIYQQNVVDIRPLQQLFMIWACRSRSSQADITRRSRRGKNLYF